MASAGVVTARQTPAGTVAVVGAVVALTRSAARVAVEPTLTLATPASVGVAHTRTLSRPQVAEGVARAQVVALAHCTPRTHAPSKK